MRLPDFYIIGAAKSGTTSLHAILDTHPGILMPEKKEPEFFARDDLYEKGIAYYAELFSAATDEQIIGEASPIYSLSPFYPHTARRIKEHTPDAKILFIMREPVDRAFSLYGQLIKNYQNATGDLEIHRTFEEFISPELRKNAASRDKVLAPFDSHIPDDEDFCLVGSDYLYQIQCYLEHFPIERFLFLKFEDFIRSERAILQRITNFLGIDPVPSTAFVDDNTKQNMASNFFDKATEVNKINKLSQKLGPLWGLKKLLPEQMQLSLRNLYLRVSKRSSNNIVKPHPMLDTTRLKLEQRYQPSFDELSKLTGLDLSDWN